MKPPAKKTEPDKVRPRKTTPQQTETRKKPPQSQKTNGQSLLDRLRQPELPPKGLNLLKVDADTLKKFGIPPRPDPLRQPQAFKVWAFFFGGSAEFVETAIKLDDTGYQLNFRGLDLTRFEGSSNWSGAYVVPTGGNMVVAMVGRWKVPALALPPAQEQAGPNAVYACSTWIGLDGQRLYLNSSLPQIGTTQTLTMKGGSVFGVSANAWFQWWDRPISAPPANLSFSVAPGDTVACLLWVFAPSLVGAYIFNLTSGQIAQPVIALAPKVGGTELTVSGATAEWIMERPTELGSTIMYPFPDYATTDFLDCIALTGLGPPIPGSFKDLKAARVIRMYDTLANPIRTQFISMAHKVDDTTAEVHYGDSFP